MLLPATLLLLGLFGGIASAGASTACAAYVAGTTHSVTHVHDGDSLKLADGRRVRLLGINTPEMGRDGIPDEQGAEAARDRLRALVAASGGKVRLLPGVKSKDAYGRLLAHGFSTDGSSLSAALLADGLGILVAVPPDVAYLDCYHGAEQLARNGAKGLWSKDPAVRAAEVKAGDKGFRLVRGTITSLSASRRSLWLKLDGRLAVRIDRADKDAFADLSSQARVGRRIEVRGWLSRYRDEPVIRVRHPLALSWDAIEGVK